MERPSLIPLTYDDFDRPKLRPGLITWRLLKQSLRLTWRAIRGLQWVMTLELRGDRAGQSVPLRNLATGVVSKLAWLPPAAVLLCVGLVWQATHPPQMPMEALPPQAGVWSQRVSFTSTDGTQLSGIWAPATKARDFVVNAEQTLRDRYPAVVLVHDHGYDARQMLPHLAALHEAGFHVLAVDLRGRGQSASAAQTFGRNERNDVAGAVEYVRSRPSTDPERIAVWALGTGIDAAIQAPLAHPAAGVVAEGKAPDESELFLPEGALFDPLRPVCRWTFDLFYAGGPEDHLVEATCPVVKVDIGDSDHALQALREMIGKEVVLSSSR